MNAVQLAEMIDAAFDVPPVCFVCLSGTAEARSPNSQQFNVQRFVAILQLNNSGHPAMTRRTHSVA